MVRLELLELNLGLGTGELYIFLQVCELGFQGMSKMAYITSTKLLGQIHLETLGSSDNDVASTVLAKFSWISLNYTEGFRGWSLGTYLAEHLCQYQSSWASSEHENG